MLKQPTISGYTTVRNALSMDYPFRECIKSVLQFADEVVVLDSGDPHEGTLKALQELATEEPRVKVIHTDRFDWKAPNHGIFDGQTKAMARANCTGDFLYQIDSDEIVHEQDAPKVRELLRKSNYLQQCPIIALPVIEYWGSNGKVRVDINPWKARLSKNLPDITHGIPVQLRKQFNGLDYASPGTDSCNYISKSTGRDLPVMGFMPPEVEGLRQQSLKNPKLVASYEKWFNRAVTELPGVQHYSWFSIKRKIIQYRDFWTTFWKAMYNIQTNERDNPFFPGKVWSEVTDEMIEQKATELEEKTNGHIFHSPWDGKTSTPHVTIHRSHPSFIQEWVKSHG